MSSPPPQTRQEPQHRANESFCAVIVGSGFGAAVTALRLAHANRKQHKICLLERGRAYERGDFPRAKFPDYLTSNPSLQTSRRVPDTSRHLWGIDQGLYDLRTLGRLQVVQAAGLGGGSLIYANVHLRPTPDRFRNWPAPYQNVGPSAAAFDKVETMLTPEPLPAKWRDTLPKTRLMREAAQRLGRGPGKGFSYPPLTINFGPPRGKQGTCNACGNCTIGCQEQAKNTLDLNYLAEAKAQGLEIRTLCEVMLVATNGADGYTLTYFDHLTRREHQIDARYVFLGAGAVGTTELLLRSKRALRLPTVKKDAAHATASAQGSHAGPVVNGLRHLGERFFANGDSLGVVFDTKDAAAATQGPTITTSILHAEQPGNTWFLLQDGGIPSGVAALLGLFRSPLWFGRNRLTSASHPNMDWLRRPEALGDRGVADFELVVGDFSSVFTSRRQRFDPQRFAVPTAWIQLLPESLRAGATRLQNLSDGLRSEMRRLDARVLEKMGPNTLFLSQLLVDQGKLLNHVAESVAELYPMLKRALAQQAGLDMLVDVFKRLLFSGEPNHHALVLLAMGPDQRGTLQRKHGRLRVDWQEDANVELFGLQDRLMRDLAVELGGELRTNPGWTLGRRPVSVHVQGGCGMGAPGQAVTAPDDGCVHGFPGLHVVDAAGFPDSVGVNPSATIAAVAEMKVAHFISQHGNEFDAPIERQATPAAVARAVESGKELAERLKLVTARTAPVRSKALCITWKERMHGWIAPAVEHKPPPLAQPHDAEYFTRLERSHALKLQRVTADLVVVVEDAEKLLRRFVSRRATHAPQPATIEGTLTIRQDGVRASQTLPVQGSLDFVFKADHRAPGAQSSTRRLIGLKYQLDVSGRTLYGRKFFHDDPGHDVWPDLTTLYFHVTGGGQPLEVGVLRVALSDFLSRQLPSFDSFVLGEEGKLGGDEATRLDKRFGPDEIARAWMLMRFGTAFFSGIRDVYERWY